MRPLAPLLCALWLLAYAAPSWVVLHFRFERDRIVREECVQRGVPLAERTCFGHCHLVRELNAWKDREDRSGAPVTMTKWEPEALPCDEGPDAALKSGPLTHRSMDRIIAISAGFPTGPEGVPRS